MLSPPLLTDIGQHYMTFGLFKRAFDIFRLGTNAHNKV